MTTRLRSIVEIEEDLAAAQQMAEATRSASRDDPMVRRMLDANDEEIARLLNELAEARTSDVEISIVGRPVVGTQIAASYLARLINDVQAAYRSIVDGVAESRLPRSASSLTVAGTFPGSFRVQFRTAEEALRLFETPLSERALDGLFLLVDPSQTDSGRLREWGASADEAAVRSVIRLAATLAAGHGTTQLRWRPPGGGDRVVVLSAVQARAVAAELAGSTGRELIEVRGHLRMAQDDPPRVSVRTPTDDHDAAVRDEELLEIVPALLFKEVVAEIVVEMTTSPTTGAPTRRSELLSLRAVDET